MTGRGITGWLIDYNTLLTSLFLGTGPLFWSAILKVHYSESLFLLQSYVIGLGLVLADFRNSGPESFVISSQASESISTQKWNGLHGVQVHYTDAAVGHQMTVGGLQLSSLDCISVSVSYMWWHFMQKTIWWSIQSYDWMLQSNLLDRTICPHSWSMKQIKPKSMCSTGYVELLLFQKKEKRD